jgi:hypothetical protein
MDELDSTFIEVKLLIGISPYNKEYATKQILDFFEKNNTIAPGEGWGNIEDIVME